MDNVLYILSYVLLQPYEKVNAIIIFRRGNKIHNIIFIEFSTSVVI